MTVDATARARPPGSGGGEQAPGDTGDLGPPAAEHDVPGVANGVVVDRRAALAAGAPPIPRKAVYWTVAAIAAFAVLATIVNRLATGGPPPASTTKAVTHQVVPGATAPKGASLRAPLPAFMGLSPLGGHPAPSWALTDAATGKPLSLAALHGHVVVLSFASAACNDICPVLGQELAAAAADLGHPAVPVTFVTINADPLATAPSAAAILRQPGFAGLPGWHFATGPLSELDPVWVAYGISITADKSTGRVSHNDLMYFVSPKGTLSWSAIPVANESTRGRYSLTAAAVTRFGRGIARYADRLAAR